MLLFDNLLSFANVDAMRQLAPLVNGADGNTIKVVHLIISVDTVVDADRLDARRVLILREINGKFSVFDCILRHDVSLERYSHSLILLHKLVSINRPEIG